MDRIKEAQSLIANQGLDGWLLYDFRRSNSLAIKFLQIPSSAHLTRRFCYFIPSKGDPIKIVHAIEDFHLDHLPGKKEIFTTWMSFQEKLAKIRGKVALEYSKIPYLSKVDAGFMDLLQHVECVSSQDLLQYFTAVMTREQIELQKEAASFLDQTVEKAFQMTERRGELLEEHVQKFILEEFERGGFITDSPPIVAFGENSANPHYNGNDRALKLGDEVLIDLWCKKDVPDAVYGDITRMGCFGEPSDRFKHVFNTVREAQKAALKLVQSKKVRGYEVDDASRSVIEKAGFGAFFLHRTGHNIFTETHGDGANIDNFETHDTREIIPGTCFSIEPGIYLKGEFGVRLEHDVLIDLDGKVEVTGGTQDEIRILKPNSL